MTLKVSLPEHVSPDGNHRAIAPYNFVPLPDMIVPAVPDANALPNHDTYSNPGYPHTGYFEVTLTTLTPTYIRGMLTEQEFKWQEEGKYIDGEKLPETGNPEFRRLVKNKPDSFTIQEKPVLPGSSLRGMLRQLFEIVTYSKMKWVTDKKLFYRTMDDTVVGESYRHRMMEKVESGFLQRRGEAYVICSCRMFRVHRDKLAAGLYDGRPPLETPKWSGKYYQHMPVWVTLGQSEKFVDQISLQEHRGNEWYEGRLIITGNMPAKKDGTGGKKKEFVFLLPQKGAIEITVPKELIERFQDDDQITQWQQKAFPANKPIRNSRARNGLLMTNPGDYEEPVFYLRENNEFTFLGRAQMFRLPYYRRPVDLIPHELRESGIIDFSEAMFGFARTTQELEDLKSKGIKLKQGDKNHAYASRIFVTNATYNEGQGIPWLPVNAPDGILEPPILASPKPTALQHYLTQQIPNQKKQLQHYDSPETTLRGFKLYWPQGRKTAEDLRAKSPMESSNVPEQAKEMFVQENGQWRVKPDSSQHTRMKPIANGKKFSFRIYFENLSNVELGALQWVLTKPKCYRLGMGKPLGMGVVELQASIHLAPRTTRYTELFVDWENEVSESDLKFMSDFEAHFVDALKQRQPFHEIDRIKQLLRMLEWYESDPHIDNKQYITDLKVYRARYVLPKPLDIGALSRAGGPYLLGQRPLGGQGGNRQQRKRDGDPQRPPATERTPPRPMPATQAVTLRTVPEIGERVTGEVDTIEKNGDVYLIPQKREYQRWLLRLKRNLQEGITYRAGESRACLVLEILREDDIVECKPAPKRNK
ncbi:MAG: TIGR03986 family CRISPR-associated RAMP protein [Anaerolineae bacterium]|nr:TIGR03986 family CRISPR-associated RAMP protein [Anaerolineae bacterium]